MDNDNKIRIPISIEKITPESSGYFFSPTKGIMLSLAIIPGIIYIPYMATTTQGSAQGLLIGLLTYGIAFITFLRAAIFEEFKWKRLFRDLEKNKLSNYKYFWGIDRVDPSGVIHYKYSGGHSLRKSVVIKLIRATKIGRDEYYEESYRDIFKSALHEIFRKGISVDVYETLDTRSVPHSILEMNKKAKQFDDELTRKIATEHVRNLAIISKTSKRIEVTYLTLYFDNPRQFKDILDYAEEISDIFINSKYFKIVKILGKQEVEKYIARTLNVNTLPADEGQVDIPSFAQYGEVVRLFNEEGDEEWVEGVIATQEIKYKSDRLNKLTKKRVVEEEVIDYTTGTDDDYTDSYKPDITEIPVKTKIKKPKQIVDIDNISLDDIEDAFDDEYVDSYVPQETQEVVVSHNTRREGKHKNKLGKSTIGKLKELKQSIIEANDEDYVDFGASEDIYADTDDTYIDTMNEASDIDAYYDDDEIERRNQKVKKDIELEQPEQTVKIKKGVQILDIDSLGSEQTKAPEKQRLGAAGVNIKEDKSKVEELIDIDSL